MDNAGNIFLTIKLYTIIFLTSTQKRLQQVLKINPFFQVLLIAVFHNIEFKYQKDNPLIELPNLVFRELTF